MLSEADLISAVRNIRRLLALFDSLGYSSIELYMADEKFKSLIPEGILNDIKMTTAKLHLLLQNLEMTKEFRELQEKYTIDGGLNNG